ncbi:SnoaL-like domain protein [Pirellulimonas nuda]|uniref:SnoaL-like domain protein n=1 Tax=Pirellulimonas nuda TaxID=2528009 RepID=A0A518DFK9_9BACT|nr:SgcJ/EcaC family oxidoreductase [Pirellulimonas nuda]QDU90260.1 SnoaL-like domain protein [Pirellulimonas nuda]
MTAQSRWPVAILFATCLSSSFVSSAPAQPNSAAPKPGPAVMLGDYVSAFNEGDAKKLAAFWTEDAVWTDTQTGEQTVGRGAIEQRFAEFFAANPRASLAGTADTVRDITPNVATIDGTAALYMPGAEPVGSRFSAVAVKVGDAWRLSKVDESDLPTPTSAGEALKELEFLVGRWVDESSADVTVETNCRWGAGGSFLVRSYVISAEGEEPRQGTQVIGYDPLTKGVRSWNFDSDGSFGEGSWTRDGDVLIGRLTQTLADGSLAAATQIIERDGDDALSVRMIGREVDGEPAPSGPAVRVTRAADQPTNDQ